MVNRTQIHQLNMWKLPAEKGKNASLLTNFPSASRKCSGLKVSGASHSFLSNSTDVRLGITEVPCTQRQTEVLNWIFVYFGMRRATGIEQPQVVINAYTFVKLIQLWKIIWTLSFLSGVLWSISADYFSQIYIFYKDFIVSTNSFQKSCPGVVGPRSSSIFITIKQSTEFQTSQNVIQKLYILFITF